GPDLLVVPGYGAVARGQVISQAPARVGRSLQPWPRVERRAEDDGHHRWSAVRGWLYQRVQHSVLGRDGGVLGHLARYALGRLAHHPHDGLENYQAPASRWVCCRNGGRRVAVHRVLLWNSCEHDSNDYRCDRRCG